MGASCSLEKKKDDNLIDIHPQDDPVKTWLHNIQPNLTMYHQDFILNGYNSLSRISKIQDQQELENQVGITSIEHQGIIMHVIDKMDHIRNKDMDKKYNLNGLKEELSISVESVETSMNDNDMNLSLNAMWICPKCGNNNQLGIKQCKICNLWSPGRERKDKNINGLQLQFPTKRSLQ